MSKAKHGTSRGVELTDEVIERLAKEAERGYDLTQLRPRRGRPPLGSEAAALFQVRLEPTIRERLLTTAEATSISPSELARRALRSYLRSLETDGSDDPLLPLIDRARWIPATFDELKAELGEPFVRWYDFPISTLNKLETAGRVDFRAGLTLLERRDEAYGAEIHVRTLIELLATVAWVTGFERYPPDVAGARQRAICLEYGLADMLRRVADSVPARFHMSKDTPRGANQRYRALKELHDETGCECKGRRWHETQASLDQLIETSKHVVKLLGRAVDENQFEQYKHLYTTASAMSHLGLWDRIFQEVAPGVNDFVPANNQVRGNFLGWIVHTYGTSCIWILELERSPRVTEIVAAIKGVLGDPLLRMACEGKLDDPPTRKV